MHDDAHAPALQSGVVPEHTSRTAAAMARIGAQVDANIAAPGLARMRAGGSRCRACRVGAAGVGCGPVPPAESARDDVPPAASESGAVPAVAPAPVPSVVPNSSYNRRWFVRKTATELATATNNAAPSAPGVAASVALALHAAPGFAHVATAAAVVRIVPRVHASAARAGISRGGVTRRGVARCGVARAGVRAAATLEASGARTLSRVTDLAGWTPSVARAAVGRARLDVHAEGRCAALRAVRGANAAAALTDPPAAALDPAGAAVQ